MTLPDRRYAVRQSIGANPLLGGVWRFTDTPTGTIKTTRMFILRSPSTHSKSPCLPSACALAFLAFGTASCGVQNAVAAVDPRPQMRLEAPADAVNEVRLDVLEFTVEGNSVLSTIDVERAVYPFLGPDRPVTDLRKAAEALEVVYRDAGYMTVFVDLPVQQVVDGKVTLQVTEGVVDRLRISGNRYYSRGWIRERAPAIAAGQVPYFPQVQKELTGLNRTADRRVTPILKPGRYPGTVEVELKVDDKRPFHGSFELNNRQSLNTHPLRFLSSLRWDNLWQREHSASVSLLASPEDIQQVRAVTGSYTMPVSGGKSTLALYAVDSKSDVAASGTLNVVGAGRILGVRLITPLQTRGAVSQSVGVGLDYKAFRDTVHLIGSDNFSTPISYVPAVLQHTAYFVGQKGITQTNVSANFAPRGRLFGNYDDEFNNRRSNARANYLYLRADAQREQVLPKGFSWLARIAGQVSSQPLVGTEQFLIGGADSVRGYYEAEQLGDNGISGRIELRSPQLIDAGRFDQFLLFGFFDQGFVRVQQPQATQRSSFGMSSTGLGLRVHARNGFTAAVDLALAMQSVTRTQAGDTRLNFRVAYDF